MADAKLSALASGTPTDSDEIYINDGGNSRKITIAALRTALGGVGFIPMDISSLREIATNDIQNLAAHGGILAVDSVPKLERTVAGTTDKSLRVTWELGETDEVQFPPVIMPPDLDETSDVILHLVAEMGGATDTPTIVVNAWDGVGDTEMGGATGVVTDAIVEVTRTLVAADISGNPLGFLNIGLVPSTHGTDALFLYAAWMEYTKKLPV